MDVVGPCVYVIVSRCFDCAAVDTSRDIGEFHFPVVVENMAVQMGKREGGNMELLHSDFPFRFRGSDGAARFGDESKLVVDIVSQSQRCRIDTVKRYIHGNGVFIAFHIDVAIKLHAVADSGTAEFAGGQVDKKRIVGVDIQVHVHMGKKEVPVFIESFQLAVFQVDIHFHFLSVPFEVDDFLVESFCAFLCRFGFSGRFIDKVDIHILVKLERCGSIAEPYLGNGGGPQFAPEDIFRTHFYFPFGHKEDGDAVVVRPEQVFERNIACDVGGDFFNGNMSPEHMLPVHGIAENAGGRKSGDLGDEEKTQDGGKQQEGKPS